MFFHKALQVASIIFFVGLAYKLLSWFFKTVGTGDQNIPISKRFFMGIEGVLLTLFTGRIFSLIKIFFVDVLFQVRILKDRHDPTAWIMHILIFYGFMGLLLLHAFNIPGSISADQYSTINPYLFLRNLLGLMLATGLVLAILRRTVWMKGRVRTTGMDVYGIVILGLIVVSGFLLEGLKINSYTEYRRMVDEYGSVTNETESKALEAYWVSNFAVVSPNIQEPVSAALLTEGREIHEMDCAQCHAPPQSAFVSYAVARITAPAALGLDRAGVRTGFYYLHILSILFGLAYFAFSKMFHILGTPVSLFLAEMSKEGPCAPGAATRQMIEFDGCAHGGTCHMACPVRIRRDERIEKTAQFSPMLDCIDLKNSKDLGSRSFENEVLG